MDFHKNMRSGFNKTLKGENGKSQEMQTAEGFRHSSKVTHQSAETWIHVKLWFYAWIILTSFWGFSSSSLPLYCTEGYFIILPTKLINSDLNLSTEKSRALSFMVSIRKLASFSSGNTVTIFSTASPLLWNIRFRFSPTISSGPPLAGTKGMHPALTISATEIPNCSFSRTWSP